VDEESITYARKNIALNNLQHRVKVLKRKPGDNLVPLDELGIHSVTFVMANPPFYSSADELASSAAKKSKPPNSACTGAPVEMVCPGGETSFVGRILDESLKLRNRVRWYTALLGKAVSVEAMVKRLREHNIDNYAVTELLQGHKTRRWAIGWSFGDLRPSQAASRGMTAQHWRHLLPHIVEVDLVTAREREQAGDIARQLEEACQPLELISWAWDRQTLSGRGTAAQNVWSRAWRRRKLQNGSSGGAELAKLAPDAEQTCVFGFRISVRVGAEIVVTARWTLGHESILFESFCAYLRGRIKIKDP
jgi:23S rRNA (adenine1618-N6)-methyltransferase